MSTNEKAFRLKKVTPRGLKTIEQLDLFEFDGGNFKLKDPLRNFSDANTVQEICEAIFEEDFSKQDFEEIDISLVKRGLIDFLALALGA